MKVSKFSNNKSAPQMYNNSCFDNAVRLAHHHSRFGHDVSVLGGDSVSGDHYVVLVDNNYHDDPSDLKLTSVKVSLNLNQAIALRKYLLDNNFSNVACPFDDDGSDALVALAPNFDLALSFSNHD